MDVEVGHSANKAALSDDSLPEISYEPTQEELERELPVVYDGQIPLGDLLSRVSQSIYGELSELAETMPNMSDTARKRVLADWVVKTKKQVVKLYAVAKWSRDADTIQKCMNITAFLMTQNQQFDDTIGSLARTKEALDPARLRNHDLLTSLDVLTTGSYLRLPTCIKKLAIPPTPLTDAEIDKTFADMEEAIRYRLRMSELIPVEMSEYRIAEGRVFFTVPNLFKTSMCLRGGAKDDGWFFLNVEFLIGVGGDLTGLQEFPRVPPNIMKHHIADEANNQLARYLPPLPDQQQIPGAQPRPQLPEGVVDAPLIRVYNFLQMMSLSYQLEILWYQAERMRSLGWADYMSVQMSPDRKTMRATYWLRPPYPNRPRNQVPLFGGTLSIAIVETRAPMQTGRGPARTSRQRVIARLQQKSKTGSRRPSDEVEGLKFVVQWEPAQGALGAFIRPEESVLPPDFIRVDANNLDFESMLCKAIQRHSKSILASFRNHLQSSKVFAPPGVVSLVMDSNTQALRIHFCGDEVAIITIDVRTGKINVRDTGDLAAAGRGPRFAVFTEGINSNPAVLLEWLCRLRLSTILDSAEQKANYLGLQSYRRRNIPHEEMGKLGPEARGTLFIRLANFPTHYLVLVVTDERFQYAMIGTKPKRDSKYAAFVLEDIAWIDFDRLRAASQLSAGNEKSAISPNQLEESIFDVPREVYSRFNLDTQGLRELYSYCCARVSFYKVESQLRLRGIPFEHVNSFNSSPPPPEVALIQSSLARSVPGLCVKSEHILSGAPAAEAAMPNIRVIPLNWWSHEKAQVVTCVKLKYVQQPMGKNAVGSTVIRPSKRIIYDTKEAIVSFLSDNVDTCVDEFLEEWASVSKMVVIAREVAQMARLTKWHGVRLLSFDLRAVEFAYAQDYAVSISCEGQLSPGGGTFDLEFSRLRPQGAMETDNDEDTYNPHEEAEPFLRNILRHGHGRLASSLHRLVMLLRDSLPIVVELEQIRRDGKKKGRNLDIFAKATGWYRLLYDDLRHALDFRLMSGQRIAILDASYSLFDLEMSDKAAMKVESTIDGLILQPLPDFRNIVAAAVRDGMNSGRLSKGKIAALEAGVVCNAGGVGYLIQVIHNQVLDRLKS
ncbi:unnamed protein product [Cyclocybe aegerita]|uniref:Mediator of RNA polymerase II transcription subunit 14 n=1 Tax=Cyclocybe aegerita TaxID=1973307 RepID=A0A8S0VWD4_CYCAE|nr:unnamed protein product [Cyclocybe aegerita]